MIYSNLEFIILLVSTVILFQLLKSSYRMRFLLLTVASLIFYSWLSVVECLVFFFVVFVSWLFLKISSLDPVRKRFWITLGIVVMTLHLFFWKYAGWVSSLLFEAAPIPMHGYLLLFPLPAGISFFTLQGIGYLVDYYKGIAPLMPFRKYLLFKSFFPQLVAGPIVRAEEMLPQMDKLAAPNVEDMWEGAALFISGFTKKVLIADRVGIAIEPVFSNPAQHNSISLFFAGFGFMIQIWGDFSGYTDMGRGAARFLGFKLPENFYSPYLSKGLSEFWRRWHVTLGTWIRDYIFIPLGGTRGGILKSTFVLSFTMVSSALWHGASTTYLIWGFYNGVWLAAEWAIRKNPICKVPKLLQWALFMFGWVISMSIFRSNTVSDMKTHITGIFGFGNGLQTANFFPLLIGFGALMFAAEVLTYQDINIKGELKPSWLRKKLSLINKSSLKNQILCSVIFAIIFVVVLFFRPHSEASSFVYFKF